MEFYISIKKSFRLVLNHFCRILMKQDHPKTKDTIKSLEEKKINFFQALPSN